MAAAKFLVGLLSVPIAIGTGGADAVAGADADSDILGAGDIAASVTAKGGILGAGHGDACEHAHRSIFVPGHPHPGGITHRRVQVATHPDAAGKAERGIAAARDVLARLLAEEGITIVAGRDRAEPRESSDRGGTVASRMRTGADRDAEVPIRKCAVTAAYAIAAAIPILNWPCALTGKALLAPPSATL